MIKQESLSEIIDIFKKSAIKFRDDFDKELECYFVEEEKEDEIVLHFNIEYGRVLKYLIIFKRQKTDTSYIPDVKGYDKLDLSSNPFKTLHFTDENMLLANIYDYIQDIKYDEIACYEKFGIILRNPLDLSGIYNINIKYIAD